ncbi:MAG TPA: polyphosphate kinase 2 family protein [Gemmatimonadales bacterium]|nr:polyphosphate kinase 2 family protein [Gemmatimonadales bacterium]
MGKPMSLSQKLRIPPERTVSLDGWDPANTHGWKKDERMQKELAENIRKLDALQYVMYAEHKHALLVVLQGMDGSGKDGTIRHVMTGLNPQGCRVTSFKVPTPQEAAHDFLWRVHRAAPPLGDIGIFNRSHYEDVLVTRVHNLVPRAVWSRRYDDINAFEALLANQGVVIVKCFLHISRAEQKKRFEDRINDPDRQWKISEADFAERKYWGAYMKAFEDVLSKCSTRDAPWYVIPADKKWFRNLAVCRILVETLEGLSMKFPKPSVDVSRLRG